MEILISPARVKLGNNFCKKSLETSMATTIEDKTLLVLISIHCPFHGNGDSLTEREVAISLWGETAITSSPSTDEKVLSCFIFSPFSSDLLCCRGGGVTFPFTQFIDFCA